MLLVSDDFGQASLPGLWANSGSVSVLSSGFDSPLANPPVFPRRVISRPPGPRPYICFRFHFLSRNEGRYGLVKSPNFCPTPPRPFSYSLDAYNHGPLGSIPTTVHCLLSHRLLKLSKQLSVAFGNSAVRSHLFLG